MAKIIAFASQKGGPGKTTMTLLTATYLKALNTKVLVIDADYPQYSYSLTREFDLKKFKTDIEQHDVTPHALKQHPLETLVTILDVYKSSKEYDFIFIDLPGTLNVKAYTEIVRFMDTIIIPVEMELKSFQAAMQTIDFVTKINPETKIGSVWTKLKKGMK